ncbi:hypothetical protein [Polaromonas sp. CG9_12]|nr:hypothetical protein [Polaromonas sp. CG9_12]CDS48712.1 hypothetical protein [Polaromonas sp. CG9_12]
MIIAEVGGLRFGAARLRRRFLLSTVSFTGLIAAHARR